MAKLARLMYKNIELVKKLETCTKAYRELLQKYNKLWTKYSYKETMELIKKEGEIEKGSKILWDNLKEENTTKEK